MRILEAPDPSTERPISYWLGLDSRGGRLIVGMNEEPRPAGVIHPGEFMDISAGPQLPWRGERLCVWSRCASSFFIHDVKIGSRSFFANCRPIPADAFSTRLDQLAVIDEAFKRDGAVALAVKKGGVDVLGMPFVLPTVQPGMDVSIHVEHIGTEPMRFVAGFFGTEAAFAGTRGFRRAEEEEKSRGWDDMLALETIVRYLGEGSPISGHSRAGEIRIVASAVRAAIKAYRNGQDLGQADRNVIGELVHDEQLLCLVPESLVPRARVVKLLREVAGLPLNKGT